jgi:hypothetical protein
MAMIPVFRGTRASFRPSRLSLPPAPADHGQAGRGRDDAGAANASNGGPPVSGRSSRSIGVVLNYERVGPLQRIGSALISLRTGFLGRVFGLLLAPLHQSS